VKLKQKIGRLMNEAFESGNEKMVELIERHFIDSALDFS
jgi:hypothetical protein